MTHLGELLWNSRLKKKITCYTIARGMGYTNTNKGARKYLRWERGEDYPEKEELDKLIQVMKLNLKEVEEAVERDKRGYEPQRDEPIHIFFPARVVPCADDDSEVPKEVSLKISRNKGKIGSYGYGPHISAENRQEEIKVVCENFEVILKNFKRIVENEQYFFCQIGAAYLSTAWIGPDGPIPLGALVLLWQKGKLIKECPDCGGNVYVFGAGGSPLSGTTSWWGVCRRCAGWKSQRRGIGFGTICVPIREMLVEYPNKPIVKKGKRQYFTWGQGLTGETTPDIIIKEKVHGVDIKTLIEELKHEGLGTQD
jgi:hypothetical protein